MMSEDQVDLAGFVDGCRGRSFRDFVWHHQERNHAPERARIREYHQQALPGEALSAAQDLAERCRGKPARLDEDCGATAAEFFQAIRAQLPDVDDGQLLDAFTYAALILVEHTRIRGARYLPVYVAMLIGGMILANVSDGPVLVVVGWLLAAFGGSSIYGAVGKPR